jgi:hypothetical protein
VTYHAAILVDILGRSNTSYGDAPKSSISAREQRSAAIRLQPATGLSGLGALRHNGYAVLATQSQPDDEE